MKFLLTPELGKLAKWLRAVGYDAVTLQEGIPHLLARAASEQRTILTRWAALRHHRGTPVVWIESDTLRTQLRALKRAGKIGLLKKKLFSRCLLCNVFVQGIEKEKVKGKVPPYVYRTQDIFLRCPSCKRVYWAATHRERALQFLRKL